MLEQEMSKMRGKDDRKMVEQLKKAERATLISTLVIVVLTILKGVVGFIFNSIVLLADAVHSFTDIITSLASWSGIKIAQRKPDEKFPYGYYKAENLAAFFISLFLIYLSFEFFVEGFNALFEISSLKNLPATLFAAATSVFVSYFLSKYLISVGKNTNSLSLIASGKEKGTDVITSLIVLVAIISSYFSIPYVEGAVTILISFFVLKEGLVSVKDTLFSLMDASPGKEVEMKIIRAISSVDGVEGFGNLKLRRAGPFIFGEVDVVVRKQLTVDVSQKISRKIEELAKKQINNLHSLSIKFETYVPETLVIAIPVKEKSPNPEIAAHLGRAKYFLFVEISNKEVIKQEFLKNRYIKEKVRAGLKATRLILKKRADVVLTKQIGEISFNALKNHLVAIYLVGSKKAKSAINDFLGNKLNELERPTKQGFETGKKLMNN